MEASNREPRQPPVAPVELPYLPTEEEQGYLAACAEAIVGGCKGAKEARSAGDAQKFQAFANGVKALSQAYVEIKTGGGAKTGHQGS